MFRLVGGVKGFPGPEDGQLEEVDLWRRKSSRMELHSKYHCSLTSQSMRAEQKLFALRICAAAASLPAAAAAAAVAADVAAGVAGAAAGCAAVAAAGAAVAAAAALAALGHAGGGGGAAAAGSVTRVTGPLGAAVVLAAPTTGLGEASVLSWVAGHQVAAAAAAAVAAGLTLRASCAVEAGVGVSWAELGAPGEPIHPLPCVCMCTRVACGV
eukprot:1157563-Pelagomonas_calceolata.AAC.8